MAACGASFEKKGGVWVSEAMPIPHPREQTQFKGHERAEALFLEALASSRMHHGWLLCGPKGVGKASFAYRAARFLLKYGFDVPQKIEAMALEKEDPVFRQTRALSHPDLLVLESQTAAGLPSIKLDHVLKARDFFSKKAGLGGWRVCIIDAADEMNLHAANGILKILEEPPPQSLFLLVAHRPQQILPTIRSRCRTLTFRPLEKEALMAILRLHSPSSEEEERRAACDFAKGAPGAALEYLLHEGQALHEIAERFLDSLPNAQASFIHEISARFARKEKAQDCSLFLDILSEKILQRGEGEDSLWTRDSQLRLWEKTNSISSDIEKINMNRAQAVLNICFLFAEEAKRSAESRKKI